MAGVFAAVDVSVSGTSGSGPAREVVDCDALVFGRVVCSTLTALLVGRSRGSGTGSDAHTACALPVTMPRPTTATTMGRKGFTLTLHATSFVPVTNLLARPG